MIRTYLDACVLIAAARLPENNTIFDDVRRCYLASRFLELEVLPKAIFHQQIDEVDFYQKFFKAVSAWPKDESAVIASSLEIASQYGLNALDALHIAAALEMNANEFVTREKPNKPIHRFEKLQICYIGPS